MIVFGAGLTALVIWSQFLPPYSRLEETVKSARYAKTCEDKVPMNSIASFPIPIRTAGLVKKYQIFYFGINPSYPVPGKIPHLTAPGIIAEMESGGSARCQLYRYGPWVETKDNYGLRFSSEAEKLSVSAYDRHEAELYVATEKVADYYFDNATNAEASDAANDFYDKFMYLSQPGFKQFYYDLNPMFWRWLEKVTGRKYFTPSVALSSLTIKGLDKVPAEARPFLPEEGFLLVKGGLISYPGRVKVDLKNQTISFAGGNNKGESSYKASASSESPLTRSQFADITKLVDEIFNSKKSFMNARPNADFNVSLYIVKDGAIKAIDSFGPPREEVGDLSNYVYGLMPAIE
ncbi:MAG: hypothetical protein NT098_05465 [Candidatus Parcubacteria bacterium]|nr:hypothetical protein [Candidatus Parcubacteria bacterium]